MIRGLPQPDWLSPDQALKLLQTLEAGLTMADLVSYCTELKLLGIRNLVWVLAPWVFVAITFKEWILVLDG